ncbi:MAG: hypothetical protein QM723_33200 [Myxococcaceae bacterium]
MKIHRPPVVQTSNTGTQTAFKPQQPRSQGLHQQDGFESPKKQLVQLIDTVEKALETALSNALEGPAAAATANVGAPAAPNSTESFKKLINEDMKTAYGREATQADYDYWLPKLQGPNDSGFVTSGQMNATEYWHRRMLGWQAGGSDVATAGPYAGGGGPHGDVQPASAVSPGVPPAGTEAMAAMPSDARVQQFRQLINADMLLAYGRPANDSDYNYWLPKLSGPNDSGYVTSGQMSGTEYWHRRMLGWQAGGSDQATSGPYAGSSDARGPVPSFIDLVGQLKN